MPADRCLVSSSSLSSSLSFSFSPAVVVVTVCPQRKRSKGKCRLVGFLLVLTCWSVSQLVLHPAQLSDAPDIDHYRPPTTIEQDIEPVNDEFPTKGPVRINNNGNHNDIDNGGLISNSSTTENKNNNNKIQSANESDFGDSIVKHQQLVVDHQQLLSNIHHPNFTFDFPLCLVHIGKAAGSSISCGLGLTYADCEGMPRPALPNTHYFHMRRNNCPQNTRTFLLTLRNPLTRLRSWFDFEKDILPSRRNERDQMELRRMRGMLFAECFPTFDSLVHTGLMHLTGDSSSTTPPVVVESDPVNMTCQERAWSAVLGVREFSYHEWYNYEHYWTALQNHPARPSLRNNSSGIVVVRTEHLIEDWSQLSKEPLFRQVNRGNNRAIQEHDGRQHHHGRVVETSKQSSFDAFNDTFLVNLCRALCPEIQIYKQILDSAQNLNESQVHDSIREVQAWCPLEGIAVRACPDIPTFPPMKVSRRRYASETKKRLFQIVSRNDVGTK